MSHLQPSFIAKAKAQHKRSGAPRQMSNTAIRKEAEGVMVVNAVNSKRRRRRTDEPWMWCDYHIGIGYLLFSLKKGK